MSGDRERPGGGRPERGDKGRPPRGVRLVDVEEVEVEIEQLVAGGDGLARWEGVPIFVPRSAPGDRLRVQLVERKPDYGRAEIVEILEPGPGRREPPCPFFARCGGCDLQHLEDDVQLELKAAATRETLERLGRLELPQPVEVVGGEPWGYRQRAQLHTGVVASPAPGAPEAAVVGYHARGSRDLVAIDRCPILAPELEALLPRLGRELAEVPANRRPVRVDLAVGSDGEVGCSPLVPGLNRGELVYRVGDHRYRFDSRVFFQAHRGLVQSLVERVVGEEGGPGTVYDLYAGVGLFSVPLAERYGRVVAVEGDRLAARYARLNLKENGVTNGEVETLAVDSWAPRLPEDAERVVVDPPRAGLTEGLRRALLHRPPRRLTYVSCHPATLARDLRLLALAFRLQRVTLFDLFPQTGHMEVVAELVTGH